MSASSKEQVLLHAGASQWSWRQLDRAGPVKAQGQAQAGSADWADRAPVNGLIDAALCVGLRLDLPRMSTARQAQALRWAAEEHLASSAEDEHVVAGPRDGSDRLCCVVIGQAPMRELMDALAHRPVEKLVPDALCLPLLEGRVSLGQIDSRVLARWGDWDFGSFEPELLDELLVALPADAELDWYGGEVPEALSALTLNRKSADLMAVLGEGLAQAPINLLSGDYASSSSTAARSYWRYAGIAAAVAALLALGGALIELKMLEQRGGSLAGALDAQFAAAFPGVTPAGRHREQAERQLSRLRFGEAAGLLDLMNRAGPVVAGQSALVMDAVSFRDGRLEFVLRAPDA
ncbi:MAG: type II secretion system protein GspL, partial [Pseudomonadota bacterium]